MLIDNINVSFAGGHGGTGIISFGKMARSGPDGGNGGKGGDVYLRATSDITLLNQFNEEKDFKAEDGEAGKKKKQSGKNGKDLEILVPKGTSVFDEETGELIFELNEIGEQKLICVGGKGGKGNWEFRGPQRTTPEIYQPGMPGERCNVKLVLRLIADFGLIGLPNAGKSSLLNELTNAKAKVGNYQFTTLSPNLGVINDKIIADIPGLIEGASTGRGLGIAFLRHIEKVTVLLHSVSSDSLDPLKDYETVHEEIKHYNKMLLEKKEIILITKSDLIDEDKKTEIKKIFKKFKKEILFVSIHDFESLEALKKILNS